MTALSLILPGAVLALGLVLVVASFRPQHARLGDALAVLTDRAPAITPVEDASGAQGVERLGEWWVRSRQVVAPPDLERQLRLRGRSLTRHYAYKLLAAAGGFLLPLVVGMVLWLGFGESPLMPVVFSLALAIVGFVTPDLMLRGASAEASEDATEALLAFFDLVTLERLANQSGTQALHAAAALSDVPVFADIRAALERARLQQRAPYTDLKELGRELDLPALRDLADVMRLDESGASLSTALRARVKELRDGHLTAMKMAASEVSERMTMWMVVPSLVFGLFFLVPPLLTLVSSG
ncbi:hypothetical protein J4N02_00845 [Propioniciclava sp. MC1595]|uniref:hypothetical protein n=1 Tax=Propioniciclava sp. MC1595 TaxID=2760308 RepID=UPI00166233A2|nr:hypothetical protein [Propioniciclava sp. MC1595]MBB1495083.1 hypothetical protein [Propioniciclava sp. MC1595]QTE26218.1 hypothetical protein J4N02_00845 [Propioniciclava sp. MC1595]